jgi:hypothetical protein
VILIPSLPLHLFWPNNLVLRFQYTVYAASSPAGSTRSDADARCRNPLYPTGDGALEADGNPPAAAADAKLVHAI